MSARPPRGRLFRALLRLFPGEFRADFGDEMEEVFAAERRDARSRPALAGLWLRTAWDALRVAPAQHLALLRRDGSYALRGLRQRPGFAAAVVATLALGFGVNAAMFGVLDATVLRPLAYPDAERLAVLWERDETGATANTSYATYRDVAARARSLESITAIANGFGSLAGDGAPEMLFGLRVTHSFFDVFGVRPLVGRGFLPEEDRPTGERVVVLGHGLWRRRFGGDPGVVGRTVEISGRPLRVVGVLPPEFATTFTEALYEEEFEYVVPLRYDATVESACRTCRHLVAVARLRPGVAPGAAAAEVGTILARLAREHPQDYAAAGGVLQPLREQVVGGARPALLALWAAVGCLLLIATANVASLLLARTAERRHELAIRAALGAGRARLFRQLLTESLVLAGGGALAGVLLAAWVLRWALAAVPFAVPRLDEAALGARVLLLVAGASFVVGLAVTLVPAAHLLTRDLVAGVESGERTSAGRARQRLRGLFVTAEVALALVLLLGAGLLLASFARVLRQDPGFTPHGVLAAEVPLLSIRYDTDAKSVAFFDRVLERLRALPAVRAVGALSMVPLVGELDTYGFHVEDRPLRNPALAPSVVLYRAAPGTPAALGLPLRAGRWFGPEDREGSLRVAVLGEGLARRYWPGRSPLGERVQFGSREDDWRVVVGVVADMRHDGLEAGPPLQAHIPYAQGSPWRLHLLVRADSDPAALAAAVRRAVRAVDPQVPVGDVRTLEEVLGASLARRRFGLLLVGGFAALALLLAGIGVYGLVAYTVQQRTRELGVRRALGATTRHLHALVLGRGLGHAALGVALGWGAGLLLARSIRSLLFGVPADHLPTYAAIAAGVLAVALLACWLPARRAAAVDPAVVLRGESGGTS